MNSDFNIRKAKIRDANAIFEISQQNSLKTITGKRPKKNAIKNGFLVSNYTASDYKGFIQKGHELYVLECDNKIKAFLYIIAPNDALDKIVNYKISKFAINPYKIIKQICVANDSHKQGYASALYSFIIRTADCDLFAAIVLKPFNKASFKFHKKHKFEPAFTAVAEDNIERGVFWYRSFEKDDTLVRANSEVIAQQYESAVSLYIHEDNLNWSKTNHLLIITGGLFTLLGLIPKLPNKYERLSMLGLCITGILASAIFTIAIYSGIKYMQHRKMRVVNLEKLIHYSGGMNVVTEPFGLKKKLFQKSFTTQAMKIIPWIIMVCWLVIFFLTLFYKHK